VHTFSKAVFVSFWLISGLLVMLRARNA